MDTIFIDLILPLPLAGTFTYRVPRELNEKVAVGMRVVVPFGQGRQKLLTGIVYRIHHLPPHGYDAKYVYYVLDEMPMVLPEQLDLWEWISTYYLSTLGDVMVAALPAAFRLSSETKIVKNPTVEVDVAGLTDKEFLVYEALQLQEVLSFTDIAKIVEQNTILPLFKSLIQKGVVVTEEELVHKYKPKMVSYTNLHEDYEDEEELKALFDKLSKAPKQLEILMHFLNLTMKMEKSERRLEKSVLIKAANADSAAFNGLIKKGIFVVFEEQIGRIKSHTKDVQTIAVLTDAQQKALAEIRDIYQKKDIVLLHGITSSGKTEVYTHLIQDTLDKGQQVLYLLPEIALTAQLVDRLRLVFGDKVLVYHSKFSNDERVEIWDKVLRNSLFNEKPVIVLGARSAVFLPMSNVGLVIVDEEHENTFKQFDPAPRYHARDVAIYMALRRKAKVLLGSATPSLESYFNCKLGKYGLVELNQRYAGMQMPEILVVDLKEEAKSKRMMSHFSRTLVERITVAIEKGEQVILFQNRRGFAPHLECGDCGWIPECENCNVSLTYHKKINSLKCHYCGFIKSVPNKCGKCGSANIQFKGFGTEKIEDEIQMLIPKARISRMDADTTKSKNAYMKIIGDFDEGKIDILVGTQMVTKGLDFANVSIVGVLNADSMLHYPDFRAFERSYQLMTQVSGRAGRKNKRGTVLIQSYKPNHVVIEDVVNHNFHGLYEREMAERARFKYPPYYRLVTISIKHRDYEVLNKASVRLGLMLREEFDERVLGPEYPLISRIRNLFIKEILIKFDRSAALQEMKALLVSKMQEFKRIPEYKSVILSVDVDPM